MMSLLILRIAAILYAGAAAGFITFFAKPRWKRAAAWGDSLLLAAFVVHAVAIGFGCREYGGMEFLTLRGGFLMLAWLVSGAFLLVQRVYPVPSVGAFATPLVVVTLLPTLFGPPNAPPQPPERLRHGLLSGHIFVAVLGVAIFALAFGVALMYLLQEREVKGKRFGALFSRLPSLSQLDTLEQRLVRIGFVVFTIALVLGSLLANQAWGHFWQWDPKQIFSLVSWLLYGALVQLRRSGLHGRRYALLSMVGFAIIITSFVGLGLVPVGKHGRDYGLNQPAQGETAGRSAQ